MSPSWFWYTVYRPAYRCILHRAGTQESSSNNGLPIACPTSGVTNGLVVPIESQGNETTVRLNAVDIADEDRDNLVSFLDPTYPTRDELVRNLHNEGAS